MFVRNLAARGGCEPREAVAGASPMHGPFHRDRHVPQGSALLEHFLEQLPPLVVGRAEAIDGVQHAGVHNATPRYPKT